jgi:AraC-like DNA-binding protein
MIRPLIDPFYADSDSGPPLIAGSSRQDDGVLDMKGHRHARGQLLGAWSGLLTIGTESGHWVVPSVHAVWVPPHEHHCGRSHGPFDGWSVYVAPSLCGALPAHPKVMSVSGLLREAVARAVAWPQGAFDDVRRHLAHVILDEIAGLPAAGLNLPMPRDGRLARIARSLIEEPADDRGLDDWAAWAGVSQRTASRRFAAETGFSFMAWRQRARIARALEMLADGSAVTTVALDLGYESISAFIALFRRVVGMTPGEYARSARTGGVPEDRE